VALDHQLKQVAKGGAGSSPASAGLKNSLAHHRKREARCAPIAHADRRLSRQSEVTDVAEKKAGVRQDDRMHRIILKILLILSDAPPRSLRPAR
jgi:hypothetical protein